MAGDEKRCLLGSRLAWKGKLFDDLARARQQDFRHSLVRADRLAVKEGLRSALQHSGVLFLFARKAQLARNNVVAEITFADEDRDQKDARLLKTCDNLLHVRLLFPKSLADLGE